MQAELKKAKEEITRYILQAIQHEPRKLAAPGARSLDWKELVRLSRFHRVVSPVLASLRLESELVPGWVIEELNRLEHENQLKILRMSAEICRLAMLLNEARVPFVLLKGPVLGRMIYGDLGARQARDVDIMIPPGELTRAHQLLVSRGYRFRDDPRAFGSHLTDYREFRKDLYYFSPDGNVMIEVHWHLSSNKGLANELTAKVWEGKEEILLGGEKVFIPGPGEYFIYLCAHGAMHRWFRLFWLRDMYFMLRGLSVNEIELMVSEARQLGLIRPIALSIRLAEHVLHCPVPVGLSLTAADRRAVQVLYVASCREIFRGSTQLSPSRRLTRVYHLSLLRPEWAYKWQCLKGVWNRWLLRQADEG